MVAPSNFKVRVNWNESAGYKNKDLHTAKVAITLLNSVMRSTEFAESIIQYRNGEHIPLFANNQGLDNYEVLKRIYAAKEIGTEPDYVANLVLILRNGSGPSLETIGMFQDGKIFTYKPRFREMTIAEIAGHYVHEWCHALGFEHPTNSEHSVPYAVGRITTDLLADLV